MTRTIYVRTVVKALACIDEADITMRAHGTVEIATDVVRWDAEFGKTWTIEFAKEIGDSKKVADLIMGILGEVNIPHQRTLTYERE